MAGGRSPKRVGYYHEKRMEAALARFGFQRQIMSGALGGAFAGDLRRPFDGAHLLTVLEVKRRANGQTLLRRWATQSGAEGLLLVGPRGSQTLAVLPLDRFVSLLEEAGYCLQPHTDRQVQLNLLTHAPTGD
jgi:hypothetical protein